MADDQRLNEQMDQLLNHPALRMQRSVIAMFGSIYCGAWRLDWGPFGGNYSGLCDCSNPCADRVYPNPRRLGDTID